MAIKRPPYFHKAEAGSECRWEGKKQTKYGQMKVTCEKVRALCRFCEQCYEHCECCPMYICPHCHKATMECADDSDVVRDLGYCESFDCDSCFKHVHRDDLQSDGYGHYFCNDKCKANWNEKEKR